MIAEKHDQRSYTLGWFPYDPYDLQLEKALI